MLKKGIRTPGRHQAHALFITHQVLSKLSYRTHTPPSGTDHNQCRWHICFCQVTPSRVLFCGRWIYHEMNEGRQMNLHTYSLIWNSWTKKKCNVAHFLIQQYRFLPHSFDLVWSTCTIMFLCLSKNQGGNDTGNCQQHNLHLGSMGPDCKVGLLGCSLVGKHLGLIRAVEFWYLQSKI